LDRSASEEVNGQRAIMLRYAENAVKGIINQRCELDGPVDTIHLSDWE
jgi:hypothetical protein